MRDDPNCGEQPIGDNCTLCHEFFFGKNPKCARCPVFHITRQTLCSGTPYDSALNTWGKFQDGDNSLESWQSAAQKMVDWLMVVLERECWLYIANSGDTSMPDIIRERMLTRTGTPLENAETVVKEWYEKNPDYLD